MKSTDWKTIGLLALMYLLFLGNAVLFFHSPQPWYIHILISTAAIHCSFTVWHEAVHGTVSKNKKINDACGVLGIFPYMLTPYHMAKWIHLMHHKNLNQSDDPNSLYVGGPFRFIFIRYFKAIGALKAILKTRTFSKGETLTDRVSQAAVVLIFLAGVLTGNIKALFILWYLPLGIAKIIMDWYINYIPHVGLPPHRYQGTRILDIPWLTPLIFAHNFHAIHHLWPTRPWHEYVSIYTEKKNFLKNQGVPVESTFPKYRSQLESFSA